MPKVYFITGSSRGLGLAITKAALASGAHVIATARTPSALNTLTSQHPTTHLLPLPLDVTHEPSVRAAIATGHAHFGRIDVVVNNAGYADMASIEEGSADDFRAQMETNFMGVVHVTRAVLPILRQQGAGHIFQVSSVGGRLGTPGLGAYQSAKWAVNGFSTVLAQEVGPLGVRVTVLEPGGIRTEWAGASMRMAPVGEAYKGTVGVMGEMLREMVGSEMSLPEEVARIVVELAEMEGEVPLRLLVGPDAVEYAGRGAEALAEGDRKWRELSLSSVGGGQDSK